jgi:hypothetical protein
VLDNGDNKSHWHEIKKQILTHWKKLNENEVEKTHGRKSDLEQLVNSTYGNLADFEREYEKICKPFADAAHKKFNDNLYGGKTPVERDLRKKTAADGFNEPDDDDEEGMTNFDDTNADYTGLALSEAEQEDLLKPDLQGMEASDAVGMPVNPETEQTTSQNPNKKTAPDEFKPNQDPRSAKSEDITKGRSNSSANTTSPSALTSSGATKKL